MAKTHERSERQVALVTGASVGIGRACAEQLAHAGMTVYGTSRHPRPKDASRAFTMLTLDVCDSDSVRACVEKLIAAERRIDVLVNNAGIALQGAVEETSLAEIQGVFETNLFGAIRMIQVVLPIMRKQRSGRIINMGSMAAFLPMPYSAAYCASKHALRGLSESLDHEVRSLGIRVSVVEPGFVKTDIVGRSSVAAGACEPYASARTKPTRWFKRQIENGVDPAVVARTVVKAATAARPSLRYLPDGAARTFAAVRAMMPSECFDFVFRWHTRLD